MERDKAYRRSCERKAKAKAKNSIICDGREDERTIGKLAHCHCVPCSCEMCGHTRKSSGSTLREKRSDIDEKEERQND